jgi:hypothetical protein
LFEDLGSEVGPADLRLALGNGQAVVAVDETFLFPCSLADAEHPIIEKANLLATDEAAARERIETITDRYAIKVKTGDRRAAIWRDESGVWWLLAAGHRKDDGPGDFYRELKRFSRDSTPIAPTQTDERYRRLEVAYAAQVEEERTAHGDLLGALLAAAARPGTPNEIALHGAVVSVRVDPDESGLAVLELSWDFTCFDEQDRFPMDVLAMVPGQEDIDSWEYLPPRRDDDRPHSWFTYVTREWVEELATSAELDGLLAEAGDWSPTNPSSDGSEHFSHRARGEVVTLAYVTGIGIVALCGARVVAHRDYERFPVCPLCEESLALLRQLKLDADP